MTSAFFYCNVLTLTGFRRILEKCIVVKILLAQLPCKVVITNILLAFVKKLTNSVWLK